MYVCVCMYVYQYVHKAINWWNLLYILLIYEYIGHSIRDIIRYIQVALYKYIPR